MSTTIDERVVEMRFDNKQFESNVSTSMSTLKKLKKSLKFTGATKGLEEIDTASKRVNMSGLGSAVDSVKAKFSAMDVVAVTALANITNQAVNAGKRLISSLSVDQISAGWNKFGEKTTSVATLVAQGNAIEDVNKQLSLLNWFTDETSYNFTDMVANIAKFTASGKGLEESVTAMEGIATWAALSGQNAMTASRAMYQLSQAMGAGVMRREDYRSIQNASMDTKEFRENCIEAAIALGTLKDNGNGTYTSMAAGAKKTSFTISQFADNLTDGMWLTSDVMMQVYTKYASAVNAIYEAVEDKGFDNASQVLTEIHDKADQLKDGVMTDEEAIDAAIKELGYTLEDGSLKFDHFGVKAFEAAQQARTFRDVIDSVKDAVSTGWMNTFEKIFGDSEQATKMWTMMANELWTTFAGGGERRNNILDQAMGSGWDKLSERISDAGIEMDAYESKVKEIAKAGGADIDGLISKYGSLGDVFKNGALNAQYLKDAVKTIETVGDASEDAKVNIDDLLESISRPSGRELLFDTISNSLQLINGVLGAFRDAWAEVFSEEGVASGLYNGLKAVKEFTDGFFELDKEGNRVLKNFDKLKSTFKGLISVLDIVVSLVGGAVKFVFQTLGVIFGNFNLSILDATAGVGDFLVMLSDKIKEGEYIGKAFSWLLGKVTTAVIALKKWIGSLFGDIKKSSAFRTIERAYQKFSAALELFREGKIGVSELTVAVKKFLGVINDTITPIKNFADTISKWFEAFKNLPSVQAFVKAVNDISDAFSKFFNGKIDPAEFGVALGKALANFLKSIPNIVKEVANGLWQTAKQIATDFLAGFQNGLTTGIGGIINNIVEFCLNFVSSFAEALGVQSPSWKAFQIMCDFIQGAINGIKAMLGPLLKALQPVGEAIVKVFKSFWSFITDENGDIEWGKLISGAITIESLLILNRFTKALDKFASAATSFSGIITGVTNLINELKLGIQRLSNSVARDFNMNALMKLAIAIGILVASVVLIAKVGGDDYLSLWNAVGIIAALSIVLGILAISLDKLAAVSIKWDKGPQIEGIKSGLIQIGIALLLVAAVVKVIGDMEPEQAKQGFKGLAAMTVGMIIFLKTIGEISTYAGDVSGFAKTMVGLGTAMLLMVIVIKMIAKLDPGDIIVGLAVMELFALFCIQLGWANRAAGQYDSGSTFMKLAISLGIMVLVMKMIRKLEPEDVLKGIIVMEAFVLMLIEMGVANRIAGSEAGKFGGTVVSMSFSMLLMAGVLKILAKFDPADVDKGIHIMQKFLVLLAEMILISKIAGKETAKIATNIISMAIAIGILVGVVYLLDQMKDVDMKKPLAVIAGLSACMTAMIWATRGASNVRQNIIALTTAVGVMAAAVVALSFIEGKDLAKATGALFSLMIAFALMTKMASGISAEDVSIKAVGWLLVLTGIVGIMTGIVIALSKLSDPKAAIANAAAVSLLVLTMAGVMRILSKTGDISKDVIKNLIPMILTVGAIAVILGEIAGVLILLKVLDINPSIETAVSLSILLLALSTACLIVSRIPSALAIDGALGLAAFIGVMAGVVTAVGLLSKIPGFNDILADGGESLRLIGTAIGNFVGGIAGGVISGAGAAIISLLPTLGKALSDFMDYASSVGSDAIKGAGYIAGAILALSGAGFISGVLGMMSLGSGSLVGLGIQLAVFGLGAKKFTEAIDGIDSSSVEAAESMADMLLALSKADLLSGITKIFGGQLDFSTMSENLVSFGEAVVSFSDTISGKIDVASVEAATSAGNMLVALNKSLPRSGGWVQDIIGEKDFDKFTTACASFAACILSINAVLSQNGFEIQSEKIEQLTKAGTQFSDLNNALPRSGGIVQDYIGEQDLTAFGSACVAFAGCILSINDYLNSNNIKIDSKKIAQLTEAGEQFSDLNNALPRAGGVAQDLAGEQDLSVFGEACAAFATCMIGVNSAVSQEGFSVNLEAIDQLKQAGDKMNELQDSLPKTGGWWEEIAGSQDIGDFGTKIGTFASAIVDFSTNASGLDNEGINNAIGAAYRIKNLLTSLVGIDYSGVASFTGVGTGGFGADGPIYKVGKAITAFSTELDEINTESINFAVNAATRLKTLITGLVGLDTSGAENFNPKPIGTAIKGYSDQISDVDAGNVSSSISVAYRLKSLISSLSGLDNSGVAKFKIVPIATNLKTYATSVAGVNASAVSSSVSAATKLKTFIAGLVGLDTSGVETFKAAIAELSTLNIATLVESLAAASEATYSSGSQMIGMLTKAFNEGASKVSTSATKVVTNAKTKITSKKGDFTTAGQTLVTSFASGISDASSTASSRAGTMAYNAGVKASNSGYSKFYDAGTYCVQGFAYGIEIKTYIVEDIAYKMGEKAAKAAKKAIDSNSPSKVFMKIGTYVPQGFAIGIGSLSDKVEGAATKMAKTAINGTRSAMTTLLDTLNTDMDMQPTIRPVVDLSDVRTGAAAVSGIFGNVQTVGVRSNLNAINLAMNSRSQNRSNDDIISAINKLGDGLANNRGDTYNFGDFTYDDGSNVANAVGELIRYAKIGRRV